MRTMWIDSWLTVSVLLMAASLNTHWIKCLNRVIKYETSLVYSAIYRVIPVSFRPNHEEPFSWLASERWSLYCIKLSVNCQRLAPRPCKILYRSKVTSAARDARPMLSVDLWLQAIISQVSAALGNYEFHFLSRTSMHTADNPSPF